MNVTKLILCFLVAIGSLTHACNRYVGQLKKVENCGGDNQIIKIDENSTVTLDKNCVLTAKTCIETIGFETAVMDYKVSKNGVKMMSGKGLDLCDALSKIVSKLGPFANLPDLKNLRCPVGEMRHCIEESVNVRSYTSPDTNLLMSMARGTTEIQANIKHNNGISCLRIIFEVARTKN